MPRGNHAQSIASNGDQKEDKTLLQHLQLHQHGEFRHVSVSERQRLQPCGQNLRVPFLRTVLPPEVDGALEQWRPTARQKRSYLHHQGEFQHNYFDFVSLHHSDHDGVVRIFVAHSEVVKRYLHYLHYAAQFFLYQECNDGPPYASTTTFKLPFRVPYHILSYSFHCHHCMIV